MSDADKLKELETRVEELEQMFDDLLRLFSTKANLTAAERAALNRKLARRARSKKDVGEGKGAVRSQRTKNKLAKDAKK